LSDEKKILKERITITIDSDVLDWVDNTVKNSKGLFQNRSHCMAVMLRNAKEDNSMHIANINSTVLKTVTEDMAVAIEKSLGKTELETNNF